MSDIELEGVKIIYCKGTGVAKSLNIALAHVSTEAMFVTHDDCTVSEDWLTTGLEAYKASRGIVTGMVLPPENSKYQVPSIKTSEERFDYTGKLMNGALYPNNMVLNSNLALAIGGFDERPNLKYSEDLDFSYRWLKKGYKLSYEPSMVVTHHDWRDKAEMDLLYKNYARCAGAFYAKHILTCLLYTSPSPRD